MLHFQEWHLQKEGGHSCCPQVQIKMGMHPKASGIPRGGGGNAECGRSLISWLKRRLTLASQPFAASPFAASGSCRTSVLPPSRTATAQDSGIKIKCRPRVPPPSCNLPPRPRSPDPYPALSTCSRGSPSWWSRRWLASCPGRRRRRRGRGGGRAAPGVRCRGASPLSPAFRGRSRRAGGRTSGDRAYCCCCRCLPPRLRKDAAKRGAGGHGVRAPRSPLQQSSGGMRGARRGPRRGPGACLGAGRARPRRLGGGGAGEEGGSGPETVKRAWRRRNKNNLGVEGRGAEGRGDARPPRVDAGGSPRKPPRPPSAAARPAPAQPSGPSNPAPPSHLPREAADVAPGEAARDAGELEEAG